TDEAVQIAGTDYSGTDTIVFDPAKLTKPITLGGTQLQLSLPSTTATVTIDGGTAGGRGGGDRAHPVLPVGGGAQGTPPSVLVRSVSSRRFWKLFRSGPTRVSWNRSGAYRPSWE